jgi:predicted ABC-type sugar transport system permease subunit
MGWAAAKRRWWIGWIGFALIAVFAVSTAPSFGTFTIPFALLAGIAFGAYQLWTRHARHA